MSSGPAIPTRRPGRRAAYRLAAIAAFGLAAATGALAWLLPTRHDAYIAWLIATGRDPRDLNFSAGNEPPAPPPPGLRGPTTLPDPPSIQWKYLPRELQAGGPPPMPDPDGPPPGQSQRAYEMDMRLRQYEFYMGQLRRARREAERRAAPPAP